MSRTLVRTALAACLLTAVFLACNTLPVGYDQLRDRVPGAAETTLLPDSAASFSRYVPLGGSDLLYLGRDSAYVSRLAIRFPVPETLTLDSITSFQVVFHLSDTSDSARSMSFYCRPCSAPWVENGVTWQMADSFTHWMMPGGDFLPDTIAAGTISGDSALFDFRYVGLDSMRKAAIRANGVILFPTDTGWVSLYSGATTGKGPHLVAVYTNNGKQTRKYFADIADASIMDTVHTSAGPYDLQVGSGVVYRTWLEFNVDSIPSQATIARAELKFQPEARYHQGDTLVLDVHRLLESYSGKGAYAKYDEVPTDIDTFIVSADSDSVMTFDIRSLVQYWTTHRDSAGRDTSNFGLLINPAPEWARTFRLRVPASGPRAPRLEIQYVLPPEDRFR
jgi:hypothetical protein